MQNDHLISLMSKSGALIAIIIVITPLCGLLFQCGCDWPWAGLDAGCNIHQPRASHQCPWCVSPAFFIFSAGAGLWIGFYSAFPRTPENGTPQPAWNAAMRSMIGLLIFNGFMVLAAGIAAAWQDYPYGIGGYWR